MFRDAKIGDRVFDYTLQKWGTIVDFHPKAYFAILVEFGETEGLESYTIEGKNKIDSAQTLFWDKPLVIAPSKPLPDLKVDTKVLVWNEDNPFTTSPTKYKRYFSHFDEDGNMRCFMGGSTSWSKDNTINHKEDNTTVWKHWEVVD